MASFKKLELINKSNLSSDSLKITQVHIEGICNIGLQISQTQIVLYVNNEDNKEAEAELTFQLDDEEVISGYEIDVDGRMVPAVVVPKEKARTVFEAEVRSHSNAPSIVENVAGNVFKIRIYPIKPKSHRIVKLTYIGKFFNNHYNLKFASSQHVLNSLSCKIDVIHPLGLCKDIPILSSSDFGTSFQFQQIEDEQQGHYCASIKKELSNLWHQNEATNFVDVVCKLPALVNSCCVVEEDFGLRYFCINDIGLPEQVTFNSSTSEIKLIGISWDCSLSRASSNFENQFKILTAILTSLKNASIHLTIFSNAVHITRILSGIQNADQITGLISVLKRLEYSGATDLSCLQFPKKHETMEFAYHLLFTDGISTVGPDTPSVVEAPVYIFSVEDQVNRNALKTIALRSGGEYFAIRELSTNESQEIVSRIHNTPFSFLSSTYDQSLLYDVYPSTPVKLQSGKFFLCGKLRRKVTQAVEIRLHYGYGSNITKSKTFTINLLGSKEEQEEGVCLLPRFWAQKKIDELLMLPESEQVTQLIEKIGKMYNIVTPTTSFIVLETLEQFLKYSIEPPNSLPVIKKEYLLKMQEKNLEEKNRVAVKIAAVFDLWERRVNWWDSTYDGENWQPNLLHFKNLRKETEFERSIEKAFRQPVWEKQRKEVLEAKKKMKLESVRTQLINQEREILIQTLRSNMTAFPNQYDVTISVSNGCVVSQIVLAPSASDDFSQVFKNFLIDRLPSKYHSVIRETAMHEISTWTERQAVLDSIPVSSSEIFSDFGIKNAVIVFHRIKPSIQQQVPSKKLTTSSSTAPQQELSEEEKLQKFLDITKETQKLVDTTNAEIALALKLAGLDHFQETSSEIWEAHKEIDWILDILKNSRNDENTSVVDPLHRVMTSLDRIILEKESELSDKASELFTNTTKVRKSVSEISGNNPTVLLELGKQVIYFAHYLKSAGVEVTQLTEDIKTCVQSLRNAATKQTTTTSTAPSPGQVTEQKSKPVSLESTDQSSMVWFQLQRKVKGKIQPVSLGISRDRILLKDPSTSQILTEHPISHLRRWAGAPATFTMDFGDHEDDYVVIETEKGAEISNLLTSYIDIILKKRKDSSRVEVDEGEVATEGRVVPLPNEPRTPASTITRMPITDRTRINDFIHILPDVTNGVSAQPPPREDRLFVMRNIEPAAVPAPAPVTSPASTVPTRQSTIAPSIPRSPSQPRAAPATVTTPALASPRQPKPSSSSKTPPAPPATESAPTPSSGKKKHMKGKASKDSKAVMDFQAQPKPQVTKQELWDMPMSCEIDHHQQQQQQQQQQQVLSKPMDARLEVEDRERSIREIENSIKEVNEMYTDLSALVSEQSEQIACIDSNDAGGLFGGEYLEEESEDHGILFSKSKTRNKKSEKRNRKWSDNSRGMVQKMASLKMAIPQSMALDNIENNIALSRHNVRHAVAELQMASEYQRKSRRKLVVLAGIPVVLLVLIWFIGLWNFFKLLLLLGACGLVALRLVLWLSNEVKIGQYNNEGQPLYDYCVTCSGFYEHKPDCPELHRLSNSPTQVIVTKVPSKEAPKEGQGNNLDYYWKKKKTNASKVIEEEEEDEIEVPKQLDVDVGFFSDKIDSLLQEANLEVRLQKPEVQPVSVADSKLSIPELIAKSDAQRNSSDASKKGVWKILSNLAEMELEDQQLYRLLGYKLEEHGLAEPALAVFQKLLKMRGEEPQSYRDLAFAKMRTGKFQESVSTLVQVVEGLWDVRFEEIELVVLMDLFGIINLMRLQGLEPQLPDHIRSKLERTMDVDIRIVLTWDLDLTNMELSVKEPLPGELCSSFHNHTKIGGIVSRDFTQGYGPQEYLLKKAGKGTYEIYVELFSSTNPGVQERGVTASVKIYTNWGRKTQKEFITSANISDVRKKICVATLICT